MRHGGGAAFAAALRGVLLTAILWVPAARAICPIPSAVGEVFGCPNPSGACTIGTDFTLDNNCVLDFGSRTVTLTGKMTVGSGTVTIKAASFAVGAGGFIDGRSSGQGGMITFQMADGFGTQGTGLSVDVSGDTKGGAILIEVGGNVALSGRLRAAHQTRNADGGSVTIRAGGNVTSAATGSIAATGGNDSSGGGDVDITTGGAVGLTGDVDASGSEGGFVDISARGSVAVHFIDVSATGDAGSGGSVDIAAGAGIQILGDIRADGKTGEFQVGGCGGAVTLAAEFGDVAISTGSDITADGAVPDGIGGEIDVMARGSLAVAAQVAARGPTGETCGGLICLGADINLTVAGGGSVDASGGDGGGDLELVAGRNLIVSGVVSAKGNGKGAFGGSLLIQAGASGPGDLRVEGLIDASVNPQCGPEVGCGQGGSLDVAGCDLTVAPTGSAQAQGPDGGDITLTARTQMQVRGTIDASRTTTGGTDGSTRLRYPVGKPPSITAPILPAPEQVALPLCVLPDQLEPPCVLPCPACGDGIIEFPETCDDGNPSSCDGCSTVCQLEDCDDGRVCTIDSCDSLLGCNHELVSPSCVEPTPTATGTRPTSTATATATSTGTATRTPTPTATATGTATRTPTATATASRTATPSASATRTGTITVTRTTTSTATATSTGTATRTATPTPSATSTRTQSATPTATATRTATATESATPTATATETTTPTNTVTPTRTPPCIGDCRADGAVTVDDLVIGVNVALGTASTAACQAFDANSDRRVSIDELVQGVWNALSHCGTIGARASTPG